MFNFKKAVGLLLCLCMLMTSVIGCQDASDGEYAEDTVSSPNGSQEQENTQTLYTLYEDALYKLYDVGNGVVTFAIKDGYNLKVGFADLQGNVLILANTYFHEQNGIPVFEGNCVKIIDGSDGDEMIIDKQGNILFEHKYRNGTNNISDLGGVSEGYFWVETFEESLAGKTYTVTYYSAKDLKAVATFENTRAFPEESYLVQESGGDYSSVQNGMAYLAHGNYVPSGLIHGESAFSFKMSDYDEAYVPSQSVQSGKWTLDLDTVSAFEVAKWRELLSVGTDENGKNVGIACLTNSSNTKYYAIVDNAGNVLFDAQINIVFDEEVSVFKDGLCPAMDAETESWGYINTKGEWVIQAQYTSARPFGTDGYAIVNDVAVIDETGNFVLAPAGYKAENVSTLEGRYEYEKNGAHASLTFEGDKVYYSEYSAYWDSSWSGTYVIKGSKITFEGDYSYASLRTGQTYSFSKSGDTIIIKEMKFEKVETD